MVHLQITDALTGAKLEFRHLPADVVILPVRPPEHVLGWPYPVRDAESYLERMKQIEGTQYSVNIDGRTIVGSEFIVHYPPNQNPKSSTSRLGSDHG